MLLNWERFAAHHRNALGTWEKFSIDKCFNLAVGFHETEKFLKIHEIVWFCIQNPFTAVI